MQGRRILEFNKRINYKFYVEGCSYTKLYSNGEKLLCKTILIMIEKSVGNVILRVPHPATEFLIQKSKYRRNNKVNTNRTKAIYIVKFLNFIMIENGKKFNVRDVYDLKFNHGEFFLNYYSGTGVKKETIIACENVLKDFYYFLAQKQVLINHTIRDFTVIKDKNEVRDIVLSPFENIDYPFEYNERSILHNLPNELWIPFIDTALDVSPRIALGIYFQFFGGLRVGEVVNIKRSSIKLKGPSGMYGIVVNLKDSNLRPDLKHLNKGGAVKKKRNQLIFPYKHNILPKLYEYHLNLNTKKGNALFLNFDGNPMTDDSYRYYFTKVKNAFIHKLLNSDDIRYRNYGNFLDSVTWSTHLGRGIFSNMIAEIAPNIAHIRQARGDSSFDAALTYIVDSESLAKDLYENQLDMWEMVLTKIEQLGDCEE